MQTTEKWVLLWQFFWNSSVEITTDRVCYQLVGATVHSSVFFNWNSFLPFKSCFNNLQSRCLSDSLYVRLLKHFFTDTVHVSLPDYSQDQAPAEWSRHDAVRNLRQNLWAGGPEPWRWETGTIQDVVLVTYCVTCFISTTCLCCLLCSFMFFKCCIILT